MYFRFQRIDSKKDANLRDSILLPLKNDPDKGWTSQRVYDAIKDTNLGFDFTFDTVVLHLKVMRKDNLIELPEIDDLGGRDHYVELTELGREFIREDHSYLAIYRNQEYEDKPGILDKFNMFFDKYNKLGQFGVGWLGALGIIIGLWLSLGSNESKIKIRELEVAIDSLKTLPPQIDTVIVTKVDTIYIEAPTKGNPLQKTNPPQILPPG
ncbi:MAG: hypothetical protein COB85_01205 [Bacteroidetes bacterium]|nr:MAG: hypothetical protein COB85_01205 [Bacteroidota bacterium]